jgi:hypothetical protein
MSNNGILVDGGMFLFSVCARHRANNCRWPVTTYHMQLHAATPDYAVARTYADRGRSEYVISEDGVV